MFDLFKRIARYVAGDEEESQQWQKDPALERDWANSNGRRCLFEQSQSGANRPQPSITEQESEQTKTPHSQGHELADQDRQLMPPPPSRRKIPSVHRFKRPSTVTSSQFDSETDARSMMTRGTLASKLGGLFETEEEKRAQQHAEAFRIHPDSGFWYQSEAGLYEHLWTRGEEPLLPFAWAPDFKTYPTVLFNFEPEDASLITNIHSPQFHAIRALRELVELGHQVRDQLQAGFKLVRIQRTIRKGIEAYVEWALNDAELYAQADTVPVHCIARRHPQRTTVDAISSLANKMVDLLTVHRQAFHTTPIPIIPSPTSHGPAQESPGSSNMPPATPSKDVEEPQILDDSQGHLPPVIIGFLVVGTTATIFTLNARNADAAPAGDLTRGIHMLGRFNFTESRFDVWNALALALTACHLRSALLAVAKPAIATDEARFLHGTLAGYLEKEEFEALRKRKREDAEMDGLDTAQLYDPKGKGKAKETTDGAKRRKASAIYDSDPDR